MVSMAFHIRGVGYGSWSGGLAFLAFKYNDSIKLLYKAYCQHTSICQMSSSRPFRIKNSVERGTEEILCYMGTPNTVKLKIEDSFIGSGPVTLDFEVKAPETGETLYKTERIPEVIGGSAGSISIFTTFIHLFPGSQFGNRDGSDRIWEKVWAGDTDPLH